MRFLPILIVAVVALGGCARQEQAVNGKPKGRTLVGTWEVSGMMQPIRQTFSDNGAFTSTSEVEVPTKNGALAKAKLTFSGSYQFDGRTLTTTIDQVDVREIDEDLRKNIIDNAQENLNKQQTAIVEWKKDDQFIARQSDKRVLLYKRASPPATNQKTFDTAD
jgi:hypothetical protein